MTTYAEQPLPGFNETTIETKVVGIFVPPGHSSFGIGVGKPAHLLAELDDLRATIIRVADRLDEDADISVNFEKGTVTGIGIEEGQ